MKNVVATFMLLLLLACVSFADTVGESYCVGDVCYTDPATLQVGATVPPSGADPNLLSGNTFNVYQNQGGAATLHNPWLLILGVPNTTATNPFGAGLTSIIASAGGSTSSSFLGLMGVLGPGHEAYSVLGVQGPTDHSNSFVNWSAAELAHDGITATSFGLYEFAITANLGAKQWVNFTLDNMPVGTIAIAYGQVITSTTRTVHGHPITTTNVTVFDTPFTQAGLRTPEPGSLSLLGMGALGLLGLTRFRK
jgi:PEP-CTERM motif-containing protein